MRRQGAILVDVHYPPAILKIRTDLYNAVRQPEFKAQIADYLSTLKPGFPKNLADILALSEKVTSPTPEGFVPNTGRLALYRQEIKSPPLTDPVYLAAKNYGLPFVRDTLAGLMRDNQLDAIVYPTSPRRPARIDQEAPAGGAAGGRRRNGLGHEFRESLGLPRPDRPGRLYDGGPADRHQLLRPGLQRAQAAGARLRLRASDARPAAPGEHAGAARRKILVLMVERVVPNAPSEAVRWLGVAEVLQHFRARSAPNSAARFCNTPPSSQSPPYASTHPESDTQTPKSRRSSTSDPGSIAAPR